MVLSRCVQTSFTQNAFKFVGPIFQILRSRHKADKRIKVQDRDLYVVELKAYINPGSLVTMTSRLLMLNRLFLKSSAFLEAGAKSSLLMPHTNQMLL
jgi:hypothetical protein